MRLADVRSGFQKAAADHVPITLPAFGELELICFPCYCPVSCREYRRIGQGMQQLAQRVVIIAVEVHQMAGGFLDPCFPAYHPLTIAHVAKMGCHQIEIDNFFFPDM